MTAMYLEHYLDSLESLPVELTRNFSLMRDLDMRAQDLLVHIDDSADDYMKSSKFLSAMEKTKRMGDISKQFTKCKEYGDDKVSLAMQTYELVDKHIRKLDADLARFEADLTERAQKARQHGPGGGKEDPRKGGQRKTGKSDGKKIKSLKRKEVEESDESKVRKRSKVCSASGGGGGVPGPSSSNDAGVPLSLNFVPMSVAASDVLDMPVDPNEPTYCVCHQVSYGEMIGCDNLECPVEWFHFGCVGLTAKPKGKWFCPKCSAERKKK